MSKMVGKKIKLNNRITIYLSNEQLIALEKFAKNQNKKKSTIVQEALHNYLGVK